MNFSSDRLQRSDTDPVCPSTWESREEGRKGEGRTEKGKDGRWVGEDEDKERKKKDREKERGMEMIFCARYFAFRYAIENSAFSFHKQSHLHT